MKPAVTVLGNQQSPIGYAGQQLIGVALLGGVGAALILLGILLLAGRRSDRRVQRRHQPCPRCGRPAERPADEVAQQRAKYSGRVS